MSFNTDDQPNFNPADSTEIKDVFDWAMKVVNDSHNAEYSERDLISQLAIAVAHLSHKVSVLEDQLP